MRLYLYVSWNEIYLWVSTVLFNSFSTCTIFADYSKNICQIKMYYIVKWHDYLFWAGEISMFLFISSVGRIYHKYRKHWIVTVIRNYRTLQCWINFGGKTEVISIWDDMVIFTNPFLFNVRMCPKLGKNVLDDGFMPVCHKFESISFSELTNTKPA